MLASTNNINNINHEPCHHTDDVTRMLASTQYQLRSLTTHSNKRRTSTPHTTRRHDAPTFGSNGNSPSMFRNSTIPFAATVLANCTWASLAKSFAPK
jgi:hypothetical protein